MRKWLLGLACVLASAAPLCAQSLPVAGPGSKLDWDMSIDAATAQAATYRHYDDSIGVGVVLSGVVCTVVGAGASTCEVALPTFAVGNHTIAITAADVNGETAHSVALGFTWSNGTSLPMPLSLRIKR